MVLLGFCYREFNQLAVANLFENFENCVAKFINKFCKR